VGDLEFRVLGPVEVLRAGRPVVVSGATTLTLLAGLLLAPNRTIPVSTLVAWAWPAESPQHPRAALHSGISRLRRLIGVNTIETFTWGYRLHVDVDDHDLLLFDRFRAAAKTALADGQPDTALAALDAAVGLWRGPLLGNVESAALERDVVPELTERYLGTVEERNELLLLRGRYVTLLEELPALVRAHPFRERLVAHLMTAQAHAGRRADALLAYDTLQRSLNADLGVDPGAPLRELRTRILCDDPQVHGSEMFPSA
jgi:DNA-binding SARP family transcriptional activator